MKKKSKAPRKQPKQRSENKRKYRLNYKLIRLLAMTGAIDIEIAEILEIPKKTFLNRIPKDLKLQEALREGKLHPDRKVVQALYRRAIGYEYSEVKEKIKHDDEGNQIRVPVECYTRHLPGDVKAQLAWLTNRTDEWKDQKTLKVEGELSLRDRAEIAAKGR